MTHQPTTSPHVNTAITLSLPAPCPLTLARRCHTCDVQADIFFCLLYIPAIDLMAHLFDCDFTHGGMHRSYPDVKCTGMPHLAHSGVAALGILITTFAALAAAVANVDLNPVSRNWLASPAAGTRLQIVACKASRRRACADGAQRPAFSSSTLSATPTLHHPHIPIITQH